MNNGLILFRLREGFNSGDKMMPSGNLLDRFFYYAAVIFFYLNFSQNKVNGLSTPHIELHYNIIVTSRLAETELIATFSYHEPKFSPHDEGKKKKSRIQLLVPENALIGSLEINDAHANSSSRVIRKKKNGLHFGKNQDNGFMKLHRRASRAQKFEMNPYVQAGESLTIKLKYSEMLQRRKGSYYICMHMPIKEVKATTINIEIRESEKLKNLKFLAANGDEETLRGISTGRVELHSRGENGVKLSYRKSPHSKAPLEVKHHSNMYSLSTEASKNDGGILLADSALVFSYDLQRFLDGGELQAQNGYFVHFISPEGLKKLPVHTVFVLDISGSMDELGKMENLKRAMVETLTNLPQEDSFQIFTFSTSVRSMGVYEATQENIRKIIQKLTDLRPYGGTNINDALLDAVYGANDYKKATGAKQIVFLTDGNPTVGERQPDVIRKYVREANEDQLSIYAVAFGNDADMKFLRQMSGENNGFARKIRSEGRAVDNLKGFYEEISTPLIADLDISYGPVVEKGSLVMRGKGNNYYAGDEIVVSGRLKNGRLPSRVEVKGRGAKGSKIQLKVSRKETLPNYSKKSDGVLERLWAYLSVQDLLSSLELMEDENLRHEMRARALIIALKHNFVTRLTSLEMSRRVPGFVTKPPYSPPGEEELVNTLSLVSPEEFAASLPEGLQGALSPSQNRRYSFVDNDPHFVVEVPGMPLPLCFDLHGTPGDVLNLVTDPQSGLLVNAEVSAAIGRPGSTYFTKIFIAFQKLNISISTDQIHIECTPGGAKNQVSEVYDETSSFHPLRNRRRQRQRQRPSNRKLRRQRHYRRMVRKGRNKLKKRLRQRRHSSDSETVYELNSPLIDAYLERGDRLITENDISRNLAMNNSGIYAKQRTKKTQMNELKNESCGNTVKWHHASKTRYDEFVVSVEGRRRRHRLELIVGDVQLHVVVTKTRNRNGQEFLGFYIQEQKILSPNTTGVIGQFVYKSVGTVGNFPELITNPQDQENRVIPLTVVHFPPSGVGPPRIKLIDGVVSKRRSLLHRSKVLCLHVKRHGRGLLAKKAKNYIRNCMKC